MRSAAKAEVASVRSALASSVRTNVTEDWSLVFIVRGRKANGIKAEIKRITIDR